MYCPKCGSEVSDSASYCPNCGAPINQHAQQVNQNVEENPVQLVAFILMIISTVFFGFALFPLIWMIPMDVHLYDKMKNGQKVGIGFGICTLLFVNFISGILLLVDTASNS